MEWWHVGLGLVVVVIAVAMFRSSAREHWTPPEPFGSELPQNDDGLEPSSESKIARIKQYRERHGVGLKEAKEAVEAMDRGEALPQSNAASPVAPTTSDAEIHQLVKSGRKIEAIKRYREIHGVGLKEAKDAIDSLMESQ